MGATAAARTRRWLWLPRSEPGALARSSQYLAISSAGAWRSPRGWPRKESRALSASLAAHADVGTPTRTTRFSSRHALDLLIENRRAQDGSKTCRGAAQLNPHQAPSYRSRRAAARNGVPVCVFGGADRLSILGPCGWPFRVAGPRPRGAHMPSAPTRTALPSRRSCHRDAVAAASCGRDRVSDPRRVDQFPSGDRHGAVVLAGACCRPIPIMACLDPYLALVFFLVILAPANPQVYTPET